MSSTFQNSLIMREVYVSTSCSECSAMPVNLTSLEAKTNGTNASLVAMGMQIQQASRGNRITI